MTRSGDERALSEVVGFILLLGLIVAVFSLWMTYVIPAQGREQEIAQMNAVKDRFTEYKAALDSLWLNNQSGITISTSFNLGTGGGNTEAGGFFLPVSRPRSSSATLSVLDTGDRLAINASSQPLQTTTMSLLEYRSANNYWLQQRYYYQSGGVFLSQDGGTANRISPGISIVNNSDNTVAVYLVPISITGGGSIGGNGPVKVDTRLRPLQAPTTYQLNSFVNISVDVADNATALMWMNSVFNESRVRGGLTNPAYYTFSVKENPVTKRGSAYINITGPVGDTTGDVYLTIRPVEYVVTLNSIASGIT
ncbi:MAG: hypothetical protein A4E35_00515 [Methanoregula sp. PtaU1.Bin051]|nr:MAG: hypothetical protein A4E35_00515 [Methanoregula sp. PtaU1.Bin051]